MNIEHQIRYDSDKLRLLSQQLKLNADDYGIETKAIAESVEVQNIGEYYPPRFIQNFRGHMSSAMILFIQGTLEFWIPKVLNHLSLKTGKNLNERPKNMGYLEWSKVAIKKDLQLFYDFSTNNFTRLTRLSKIRNDEAHNGGFVSEDNANLPPEPGIDSATNLYVIRFEYISSAIDLIEKYLIDLLKAPPVTQQ